MSKFSNRRILSLSNLLGLILTMLLLLDTEHLHLVLVLLMDLVADAFEVLPQLGLLLHLVSLEGVGVLLLSDFLLFVGHL